MASASGSTAEETMASTSGSTSNTSTKENSNFVTIPNLLSAGISTTNDPCTFYRRQAFQNLTDFVEEIVKGNHIGLVDGLPGTGKSSTIWWAFQQLSPADVEMSPGHIDAMIDDALARRGLKAAPTAAGRASSTPTATTFATLLAARAARRWLVRSRRPEGAR